MDEEECKQRIARYTSGIIASVTTDLNAFCVGNRVYVTMQLDRRIPFGRRTPLLIGRLRPTSTGTEIVGRSGGDLIAFWLSVAMEIFLAWNLLTLAGDDPVLWLVLLVPPVIFFLTRRSPEGGQFIDFLQQLLEAEDVLTRTGDPIVRV